MRFFDQLAQGLNDIVESLQEMAERERRARRERLAAIAGQIGLGVDDRGHFVGELEGVPIRRYSRNHGTNDNQDYWTHTALGLRAPLPAFLTVRPRNLMDSLGAAFGSEDVQIGHPVDPAVWVRCLKRVEPQAVALLGRSGVADGLMRAIEAGWSVRLEGSAVELRFRGRHERAGDKGLALGLWLAHTLDDAIEAEWLALADEELLHRADAGWCVEGHLRGVPVRVEVLDEAPPVTRVIGWFEPRLPGGTRIADPSKLKGGVELDDPILGKMVAVHSSDPVALGARVCTDAARGPLLEIVCGQPGSRVLEDRVVLDVPGHVGVGLRGYVDVVVELAAALGG